MTKNDILDALTAFAEQPPGMIAEDYNTREQYEADHERYCAEPLAEFRAMRQLADDHDGIDAEALTRAIQWTSRVSITDDGRIDYTPGQNGALEYRTAACNVLSEALIEAWRPDTPDGEKPIPYAGRRAAESMGAAVAKRWFR